MNQIVAVTAETILARSMAGRFIAWDEVRCRFQEVSVPPDFIPTYGTSTVTGGTIVDHSARNWRPEEFARLVELRAKGMLWREIGADLGRGSKICAAQYVKACQLAGVEPVITVANRASLSDDDKARCVALRARKMSSRNIARALGLTRLAVGNFFSNLAARERIARFNAKNGTAEAPRKIASHDLSGVRNHALKPVILDPKASDALAVIRSVVCNYFGMDDEQFRRGGRQPILVRARHVFCYLARKHTGRSYPIIGKALGCVDHTTVIHGVNKVQAGLDLYADDLAVVEKALGVTG